jgi:hypothetical protein
MGYAYIIREKMRQSKLVQHETKRDSLSKFIFILSILVAYFWFVAGEYGAEYGIAITALTWSFFVMCTPIADAGFLIDFPLRVFADIRMMRTEIMVWVGAIAMNVYSLLYHPGIYEKTIVLKLFNHILITPYPFWGIIILSAMGTFLSIYFGDELMDVVSYSERTEHAKHKLKHDFILFLFIIIAVIALYDFLLEELGVEIPF